MEESTRTEQREQDPEILSLVPVSRWWVRAGSIVIAVAIMVGLWWVIPWISPTVSGEIWESGSGSKWSGTPFVLTENVLSTSASPVKFVGVNDLSGARVVAAWVTHGESESTTMLTQWFIMLSDLHSSADASAIIDNLSVVVRIDERSLPQTVRPGDHLWVLWQITNCDALTMRPDPKAGVRVQTMLGFTVAKHGDVLFDPRSFGWDDDLSDKCPI